MELILEGNLRDLIVNRIDQNKNFSDLEASILMKNILKAVKYIHIKNIVHRDLKPCIFFLPDFKKIMKLI